MIMDIISFFVGIVNLMVMVLCFKMFLDEYSNIKFLFLFIAILNFICMIFNFYWVIQ